MCRPTPYPQRRPRDTVLYRVVSEHLETWLERSREACTDDDPVPGWKEEALRRYLTCGIFQHGFCRVRCDSCGHDYILAFSCKTRSLCPSCASRHMVETAAYITDEVMPRVPVRQWVLSLPKRVRFFLERDPRIAAEVQRIYMRAVETMVRRTSPGAPRGARFGAVGFKHRAGAFINRNFHYHSLVTDGVFAEVDGEMVFFEATGLTRDDVLALQRQVRRRVLRWFERQGLLGCSDVEAMLGWEHEGGFSLDASVRLEEWDRGGLERVARYCARPALSLERLGELDNGRLIYQTRRFTADGRNWIVFEPMQLLSAVAALIQPPRVRMHTYFGVLAPHSSMRKAVVESAGPAGALMDRLADAKKRQGLGPASPASRMWAMLLSRIYEELPLLCPRCGSAMRILSFITEREPITRILDHIGMPSSPPEITPARDPPQVEMEMDQTLGAPDWN
jgi:hypothetical protein